MRSQWFIIQTLSGQEHKVKDSIEKRIKTEEMQDFVKEVLVQEFNFVAKDDLHN